MTVGPLVLGSLSLLLMVDPWAKNVDVSGGAVMELRGGLAPPQPSQPSEPALWLSLAPQGTLLYHDRVRGRTVSLDYVPQLFLRVSEGILAASQVPGRPLFFQRATLRYSGDLRRRLSWQGSAGASIGEQDYSLQSGGLVQGDGTVDATAPTQGALLDQPIITTGGFSAAVGLTGRLTPLHSISLGPSVTVQRLLSDEPATGAGLVSFDQTSADLSLTHAWLASRVDTVSTTAAGGYADFGLVNGSQAYGSADLTWRRRLRPRLDSQVLGGVFLTQQLRERQAVGGIEPATRSRAVPIMPITNLGLNGRLLERSRVRLSSDLNVGSQAYFDPVQGSVLPLAGGGASVNVFLPPDLTVGLVTTFYTPANPPTEQERRLAADPASARTALTVRTPVSYDLDRHFSVEAGTIVTLRGPSLRTPLPLLDQLPPDAMGQPQTIEQIPFDQIPFGPWRFTQTEVWLYVSFRMRYTTARGEGNRAGGGGSTISGG